LLAFAIVEEQRIEWIKHFLLSTVAGLPMKRTYGTGTSSNRKGSYAERTARRRRPCSCSPTMCSRRLEAERRRVAEGVVVGEVRMARRFWPQFGISVAGGFVRALVLAAILARLAFVVWQQDPSPVQLGRHATGDAAEEQKDGEASGGRGADE
jgi:hypothetical protein